MSRSILSARILFVCWLSMLTLEGQTGIPIFTAQPEQQLLRPGDTMELRVALDRSSDSTIQWFHNGELLEGETALTLIIPSVDLEDAGKYFATATNSLGTAYSEHARVRVRPWFTEKSVARQWMEELLDAIRLDYPAPTVHSRNLFTLSSAMWNAWAAYDVTGKAVPYIAEENLNLSVFGNNAAALRAVRDEAISYAAYRVLRSRFRLSPSMEITAPALTERFVRLGYDPGNISVRGDSPSAVGNRIAAKVLAYGWSDASNERNTYEDPYGYTSVNPPLVFKFPGTSVSDPNRWQPLAFDSLVLQNGIVIGRAIQSFLGSNWGGVVPFALSRSDDISVYNDPGPPPYLGGEGDLLFKEAALQVIEFSSWLDPTDGVVIDVSPRARHNNSLGTNDGTGYPVNPYTGNPYEENQVLRADYGRILAEFWADGPSSETPPGHWNAIANYVSDHELFERRFEGSGDPLDDLEWDVKLYFAINGAVSDAAIACWDAKRKYDYARPITMIRYMGGLGQSSDPAGPSYHPNGLILKPGLVEVITAESTGEGQRHAHLFGHEGEIAVFTWKGIPENPITDLGGVGWVRAVEWLPYQRDTFVSPPFAGYTSGHSTFSRAAAAVLTAITGDPYFPGGISSFTAKAHEFLEFESGPEEDITLTWATYFDAADEAGISRLYGGIHVAADDFGGRIMGSEIGKAAFAKARTYFDGSASTQDWETIYQDWVDLMIADPDQPPESEAYLEEPVELLAAHFLRGISLVNTSPETPVRLVNSVEGTRPTLGVECFLNLAEVPHELRLEVSSDLENWITIPESKTYTYRDPVGVYQQRVSMYVRQIDLPPNAHFLRVKIREF